MTLTKRALALGVAFGMVLATPAIGAPKRAKAQKSDNTYTFVYNDNQGRIVSEGSSAQFRRNDRLSFFVYIRERPPQAPGPDLVARLRLRLEGDRAMRVAGRFKVVVTTSDGEVVVRKTKVRRFVLRPRKGERLRVVRFPFKVPTGHYEAKARFRPC